MSLEPDEPGSPQTVLFALLKQYLYQTPFQPFRVVTTSGRAYDVPTADHAGVVPKVRKLTIVDDSGREIDIHTLHVSAIERLVRLGRRGRSKKAA
jgi:hypothetical protein